MVVPDLCRLRRVITAASQVSLDPLGWAVHNVDSAAVRLPAGESLREVHVRIRDAPIVLLFEFVLGGRGCRIAAHPESFYEAVAVFICRELPEGRALF